MACSPGGARARVSGPGARGADWPVPPGHHSVSCKVFRWLPAPARYSGALHGRHRTACHFSWRKNKILDSTRPAHRKVGHLQLDTHRVEEVQTQICFILTCIATGKSFCASGGKKTSTAFFWNGEFPEGGVPTSIMCSLPPAAPRTAKQKSVLSCPLPSICSDINL